MSIYTEHSSDKRYAVGINARCERSVRELAARGINIYFTGHTLAIDGQNGVAYLIADSSVVKLDMSNRTIMNRDLMNGNFYSIAADGATGDVYVTEANSGTADGKVYIYTSSGQYTNRSFTAGIYPDGIVFVR